MSASILTVIFAVIFLLCFIKRIIAGIEGFLISNEIESRKEVIKVADEVKSFEAKNKSYHGDKSRIKKFKKEN